MKPHLNTGLALLAAMSASAHAVTAPDGKTTTTFEFESIDGGARTLVTITESSWQATRDGARAAFGNCEGWTGMLAALTPVPVFGVPVPSKYLRGEDSLLSIVQMPKGVPVATFAIGEAGAANAALHVIATLAATDAGLHQKLVAFRARQTEAARAMKVPPEA